MRLSKILFAILLFIELSKLNAQQNLFKEDAFPLKIQQERLKKAGVHYAVERKVESEIKHIKRIWEFDREGRTIACINFKGSNLHSLFTYAYTNGGNSYSYNLKIFRPEGESGVIFGNPASIMDTMKASAFFIKSNDGNYTQWTSGKIIWSVFKSNEGQIRYTRKIDTGNNRQVIYEIHGGLNAHGDTIVGILNKYAVTLNEFGNVISSERCDLNGMRREEIRDSIGKIVYGSSNLIPDFGMDWEWANDLPSNQLVDSTKLKEKTEKEKRFNQLYWENIKDAVWKGKKEIFEECIESEKSAYDSNGNLISISSKSSAEWLTQDVILSEEGRKWELVSQKSKTTQEWIRFNEFQMPISFGRDADSERVDKEIEYIKY